MCERDNKFSFSEKTLENFFQISYIFKKTTKNNLNELELSILVGYLSSFEQFLATIALLLQEVSVNSDWKDTAEETDFQRLPCGFEMIKVGHRHSLEALHPVVKLETTKTNENL